MMWWGLARDRARRTFFAVALVGLRASGALGGEQF